MNYIEFKPVIVLPDGKTIGGRMKIVVRERDKDRAFKWLREDHEAGVAVGGNT